MSKGIKGDVVQSPKIYESQKQILKRKYNESDKNPWLSLQIGDQKFKMSKSLSSIEIKSCQPTFVLWRKGAVMCVEIWCVCVCVCVCAQGWAASWSLPGGQTSGWSLWTSPTLLMWSWPSIAPWKTPSPSGSTPKKVCLNTLRNACLKVTYHAIFRQQHRSQIYKKI